MAAKKSPITPTVLAWAMSEDGRPREQIAEALDIDLPTLEAWANGDDRPTVGQVTELAEALKRPRALFFLPRPPSDATLPASFRHPPGDDRQISSTARREVRQARRVQAVLAEALAETDPIDVPRFALRTAPADAAAVAREWLAVTAFEQHSWSNEYEALRAWRDALDTRGVFVFQLEIGKRRRDRNLGKTLTEEVRGFSAWDDHAPLIVMNGTRVSPAARCFTLGHEFGHLTLRADAACIEPQTAVPFGAPLERWCEEFAAALLMPEREVRAQMQARGLTRATGDLEDVRAVMRGFQVSGRAAALRLIDLGLAQRSLYATVEAVFRPSTSEASSPAKNPPRARLRLRQFGQRALDTVLRDADPVEALSVLRMTVPDARDLAEQVPNAALI